MILGMIWGRCSIRLELGDGMSERWMASAEASSTRSVRRVKTLLTSSDMITRLMRIKTRAPRRMVSELGDHRGGHTTDIRLRKTRNKGDLCRSFVSRSYRTERRRGGREGEGGNAESGRVSIGVEGAGARGLGFNNVHNKGPEA